VGWLRTRRSHVRVVQTFAEIRCWLEPGDLIFWSLHRRSLIRRPVQALPVVKIATDDIRAHSPHSVGFRGRRIARDYADLATAPHQCGCRRGASDGFDRSAGVVHGDSARSVDLPLVKIP